MSYRAAIMLVLFLLFQAGSAVGREAMCGIQTPACEMGCCQFMTEEAAADCCEAGSHDGSDAPATPAAPGSDGREWSPSMIWKSVESTAPARAVTETKSVAQGAAAKNLAPASAAMPLRVLHCAFLI